MKEQYFLSLRWKMILKGTLAVTLTFLGVFYWLYITAADTAVENLYAELAMIAQVVAEGIDGDLHQALLENPAYDPALGWPAGMTDARYWEIAQWLHYFHLSNPNAYLYTYTSPEPGIVEFVVSEAVFADPELGAAFRERYEPQPPSVILDGLLQPTNSKNTVTDRWGKWVSAFHPIYNAQHQIVGAVGVDYYDTVVSDIRTRFMRAFVPVFILSYSSMIVAIMLIANRTVESLANLSKSAKQIGDGKRTVLLSDQRRFQDEISVLGDVITEMARKIELREAELSQLTQNLHQFYQASVEEREREKSSLAMNIHDEILNRLGEFSIRVNLDNPELGLILDDLIDRVRSLSLTLRPVMLNYGLRMALEEYMEEFASRMDLQAALRINIPPSDFRYNPKIEEHVFRIVQQALENVYRHAQAETICLDCKFEADWGEVVVADDGVGMVLGSFQLYELLAQKHFGLANMYERANLIGAKLEIQSASNEGTRITIKWGDPKTLEISS